jgi:hypothetical protein
MKKNMGSTDKAIRIVFAIVFAIVAFNGLVSSPWNYVLLALSAVFLLTSFVSFCPLYAPFGISTCKVKNN